jgi:site-specific DNA-methyltransferase (adenine-specific)
VLKNRSLFFGDNLHVLREKFPGDQGYFDLIYLDPPFNSKQGYNVLFKEGFEDSPAQVQAFEDTWHWTADTKAQFEDLIINPEYPEKISDLMVGLGKIIGHNDVLAYLTMMSVRLIELRRVLKTTGCIYVHCDPTASHYLKIIMDAIFGPMNFINDIVWERYTRPKGSQFKSRKFGSATDNLLFYSKSSEYKFNLDRVKRKLDEEGIEHRYNLVDEKGAFYSGPLLRSPSMGERPNLVYEYRGYTPGPEGWRMKKEKLMEIDQRGDFFFTSNGIPRRKIRPENTPTEPLTNIWTDINAIGSQARERLGYPTQKPQELLERIIAVSSDEGDWILDPFGGCGTTAAAAEKLKRNWVIVDVTTLAINLVKRRIQEMYKDQNIQMFTDGLPEDVSGARVLFEADPFEFEYWACDLINARPAGDKKKGKMKGADQGIDGVITYPDIVPQTSKTEYRKLIVQVKGGSIHRNDIATLKGDVDREKAAGGIFITLQKPTKPMINEATEAGTFVYNLTGQKFPKIQILTIEDLFKGKRPNHPSAISYAKKAEKMGQQQQGLF